MYSGVYFTLKCEIHKHLVLKRIFWVQYKSSSIHSVCGIFLKENNVNLSLLFIKKVKHLGYNEEPIMEGNEANILFDKFDPRMQS